MISSSEYASIYPRQYVAYRSPPSSSSSPHGLPIIIDGNLDKPFWNEVDWSEDFVDIATDTAPKFRTRMKMRWDGEFLYVGAYMVRNSFTSCCCVDFNLLFLQLPNECLSYHIISYHIISHHITSYYTYHIISGRNRCLGYPHAT